ncbi:TapY2 family type IVa secretion system protein [Shewanella nanhaiensis]|uniref:TapY2 family type IVa secretion system protein n=1 Tax=Shewanella nanhaiensis TaxID=2864872 RepID=A0ABS7E503_9GAMM|nr:TapY2 family type IVa secretion system protein [Shewanella nanhaiensis]MBW8184438.1 TapY2 family type IVa secretion system protein [Shewanella nanhaiensis]
MKCFIMIPIFLLSLSTTAVASEKQDYKCFVNSTDGDKVVFYRWKTDELKLKMAKLVGRTNTNKKGKKYFIKEVQECVHINDTFESADAQKVDKVTLH